MDLAKHTYFISLLCLSILYGGCKTDSAGATVSSTDQTEEVAVSTPSEELFDYNVNAGRVAWQKPELVIKMLGDLSNKTVADIGAGTGYFAFRLSFRAEKVIAIDIDPTMIQLMEAFKLNLDEEVQERFETRLTTEDNPGLTSNEVDVVIIINTIGYIENQKEYLASLHQGLKKDGRIMIVDFKMKRLPISAPDEEYRVPINEMENMLMDVGYEIVNTDDTSLDYQYVIIANKI